MQAVLVMIKWNIQVRCFSFKPTQQKQQHQSGLWLWLWCRGLGQHQSPSISQGGFANDSISAFTESDLRNVRRNGVCELCEQIPRSLKQSGTEVEEQQKQLKKVLLGNFVAVIFIMWSSWFR